MRQALVLLLLLVAGCGGAPSTPAAPPAHAETIARETELLKLTLTPEAQRRLGIVLHRVKDGSASTMREVAGEIVVPPTSTGGVPINSATSLQQIGTQQAAADAELARATAQARLARIALVRADSLVREEAGSDACSAPRSPRSDRNPSCGYEQRYSVATWATFAATALPRSGRSVTKARPGSPNR